MRLNVVQEASLKRLQKYRTHPPTLRERMRLSAVFMLALLVPTILAGLLLIWLEIPGALFLVAGLFIGGIAREIGQQRQFVLWWPLNRHLTDWSKVDELLASPESLPDSGTPAAPAKSRPARAAVVGIAAFALIFGAAVLVERALVYAYDPTRGNEAHNVIVLTTSWCGYCRSLRQHLAERNIPYTDLDVEHTTEGRYAYNSVRGRGVPITIVGSQVIRGVGLPDERWKRIDSALLAAGYEIPGAAPSAGQREEKWIDSAVDP
jgi:mycoredoxin